MAIIQKAYLVVEQEHHFFCQKTQCGTMVERIASNYHAIYPLDLKEGHAWLIGRAPTTSKAERIISLPNPAVTRFLGKIKSLKTESRGNLHLLEVLSRKSSQFLLDEFTGNRVGRCVLRNGDTFQVNDHPLKLTYFLKSIEQESNVFDTLY